MAAVRSARGRARAAAPLKALVAFALCATLALPARAEDRFLGSDKALHFSASALIAAGGYGLAAWQRETTANRLALGAGLALTAGVAKELWDTTGRGDPSAYDLAWDVIGTAAGLLVTWLVDHLLELQHHKSVE